MNESKADLTNRLRREGRWPEASAFKDTAVKELRSQGMKRREAREEACRRVSDKFPPVVAPVDATPEPAAASPAVAVVPSGLSGLSRDCVEFLVEDAIECWSEGYDFELDPAQITDLQGEIIEIIYGRGEEGRS